MSPEFGVATEITGVTIALVLINMMSTYSDVVVTSISILQPRLKTYRHGTFPPMSDLLVDFNHFIVWIKLNNDNDVWVLVSDGQRSCITLCATRLPPWFAIRNEDFIAFPDPLRRAPDTHPKFTGIHPIVPKESIRPLWDSSVVVDKSRLITRFVSIDP